VRVVLIAALTLIAWEGAKTLWENLSPSFTLNLQCVNDSNRPATMVLVDPNAQSVHSSRLDASKARKVRFPLTGDSLPKHAGQVYTLMVFDDSGNQVWTRPTSFQMLWDIDGLRITDRQGAMTVEPHVRPNAHGAESATSAPLREVKP
jgi:hypothetical protein